ncbi:ATP-binding cassette domain-containing protein [Kineococcus radiotolerans]|uniref:ABC transporter related n=1 Tax=Kineococcus radiotolerans (strain ATCC BAA-149 / DSM 14245 / SRS30216) TaxID=266940 RepID=A6W9H4_KINRD|nr:ATP-binding cassette domain-containing protein [Kineococcus radiotolerans]ABS03463.1 ABC transporter related [Kineococcus radiotolerans SRS30216 = ATCC BAA-149]
MITAEVLTKRYGTTTAVDGLSFTARPGTVTGFLGPNGAGKSTTMRMVLGLERPTAGTVTVDGQRYADLRAPLRTVGAMLDARSVHPGRTAFRHLLALARTHGIPRSRVDEVIGLTGLEPVAGRRVRGFSLGMGQRLGIAAALLGDPATLVLDEPVNGLDPDGVLWVRRLVRDLADEGRTVFLSSHLMHELALCADRVVVIGRGRLLADASVQEILQRSASAGLVRVRTTGPDVLARALGRLGADVAPQPDGALHVRGVSVEEVGAAAGRAGVTVLELAAEEGSLEDAYLELTGGSVQYRAGGSR